MVFPVQMLAAPICPYFDDSERRTAWFQQNPHVFTGNSQLCGSACELSDSFELSEALSSQQLGTGLLGYAAVSQGYHHQIKGSKEKPFPNRSKPPLKQLENPGH